MKILNRLQVVLAAGLLSLVSGCSDPEPLAYSIDRVEVYMVNVIVNASVESPDTNSFYIAPALGEALGDVADQVRAGAIKITPETEYVQMSFAVKAADGAHDIGNFRVPIGRLADIQDDAAANLEAVDLVASGTSGVNLEPMRRYCMVSFGQRDNPKFCALIEAS